MSEGLASRVAAWKVLRRVHTTDAWSAPALDTVLRRGRLDARDRAFAANLAYSTLRWEGTLDWALGAVLTRPLDQVQDDLVDVLRLGAWQLLLGEVPDRAAVGTSVDLAREVVGPQSAGFANGVLRALGRRRETLPWPSTEDDHGLGLATGYPGWIAAAARERVGAPRARALLEAGNEAPGLTLRAMDDRAGLIAMLRDEGVDAEPGAHAAAAIRAPGADPGRLELVRRGRATPQDEASMLVVEALEAALGGVRGARVLDAAAAPGGKATHLASLGADVVATDVRPGRARQVAQAARRLGVGVAVAVADAARPPWPARSFDAVLLDAPCSGLGVVRRRPELRWRRTPEDVDELADLQVRLLTRCVDLLRPGGVLVFSVCTWTVPETVGVVRQALAAEGDRIAVEATAAPDDADRLPGDPGVLLLPDRLGTDGFYVATFRRTT